MADNTTHTTSHLPIDQETFDAWKKAGEWLMYTVIALSIINFITLTLVIVSYAAMTRTRRRSYELDLFLACMERQIQRSVLPPALVQRAIEASNMGSVRELPTASIVLSGKHRRAEASKVSIIGSLKVDKKKAAGK